MFRLLIEKIFESKYGKKKKDKKKKRKHKTNIYMEYINYISDSKIRLSLLLWTEI